MNKAKPKPWKRTVAETKPKKRVPIKLSWLERCKIYLDAYKMKKSLKMLEGIENYFTVPSQCTPTIKKHKINITIRVLAREMILKEENERKINQQPELAAALHKFIRETKGKEAIKFKDLLDWNLYEELVSINRKYECYVNKRRRK